MAIDIRNRPFEKLFECLFLNKCNLINFLVKHREMEFEIEWEHLFHHISTNVFENKNNLTWKFSWLVLFLFYYFSNFLSKMLFLLPESFNLDRVKSRCIYNIPIPGILENSRKVSILNVSLTPSKKAVPTYKFSFPFLVQPHSLWQPKKSKKSWYKVNFPSKLKP